jgi:hypothetical protein
MPRFLDVHPLKGVDEDSLRRFQNAPVDEFQVKAINLMYNYEADRFYCLLEAPNKQAIKDHHNKYGFECEWITEVKTTA